MKVEAEGADGLNELRFNMPSWQDFRSSCCGAAHHVQAAIAARRLSTPLAKMMQAWVRE